MNYLSAEKIGRNIGERWIFSDITFGILQGEKVALIGANGSGKSSLMDVLTGEVAPDTGVVSVNKDITFGYLKQNPEFSERLTVLELLFSSDNEITQTLKMFESASRKNNAEEIAKYAGKLTELNGWDYEAKVKQILGRLGIQEFEKELGHLSGGQRKRVYLAKVLIEEPDFLILDEPTNHLDLDTIEWLEAYLSTSNMTLLLVTHDRYFLDKVCNRIVELKDSKIYNYKGNYAYFLEKKAEREEIEATVLEKDRRLLKKELSWMRTQPRARTTKAQYRINEFHELQDKVSGHRKEDKLQLSIKTERVGNKIMEIRHVSKSLGGKKLISEFTYTFKKGDRIGIVGKNGVGKSTLLGLINQEIKPDMGKVVKGETIKIGYYKQEGLKFEPGQKVIDHVREIAEYIKMADGREMSVSAFLTLFLFPPAVQYDYISNLSGGERRRLQLLKVLISNPNFLILDEPTNDLDIATLNVLEEFLESYQGVLLMVSHDRYFLDRLVDHTFAFEGNGVIKDYPGNYTDYRNWADEQQKSEKKEDPEEEEKVEEVKEPEVKKKLTFNEQREFDQLEKELPVLEKERGELTEKLSGGIQDFEEIAKISARLEELVEAIDEKEMRWLELSEYV